ncbi:MAG: amino acid permease [Bryobacterales bacterium]|nr:amino acid permease [Bryobacteraceae bacterium]MDW8354333.1 amino acid permease [Bryobacterales bacterium]
MSLFATKPLERILAEAGEHTLRRTLGPGNLVALGIGAIIGAGLFSLTGIAAAEYAGPAIALSFVLAAIGCALAGFCYSEFATMIPIAGSAYTYAYATMGELIAWIIGWDLVLEYAVGASTVSISWSAYVVSFLHDLGIELPPALIASPWQPVQLPNGQQVYGVINLPAVFIVVVISCLLIAGIKESATANAIMVAIKVAVVVVFIAVGAWFIKPENYTPFIPPNTGTFGEFGWSGILKAAGVIFFAYIGFDAVSTAAQEARNPQKDMPVGIIGSLAICTVLYVLFAVVMTGLAHYTKFKGAAAPVAVAVAQTPYGWLGALIKLAILAGLTSVILVMLLGQSRIFFSMSRDGLLPKVFSDIHPRFRTPWRSNLLLMLFVSLFSAFAPISAVGQMTSIGTLFAFVIVCAGILVMRKTQPDVPRPFRTPWVPVVPVLGILVNALMIYGLGWSNWLRLLLWLALGLAIYFGYGRRHSLLTASRQLQLQKGD